MPQQICIGITGPASVVNQGGNHPASLPSRPDDVIVIP